MEWITALFSVPYILDMQQNKMAGNVSAYMYAYSRAFSLDIPVSITTSTR